MKLSKARQKHLLENYSEHKTRKIFPKSYMFSGVEIVILRMKNCFL